MKKQTIHRGIENDPGFISPRGAPQDRNLSFEARGVLWYLLSKPGDWQVQINDLEQRCGKDKVYRILNELIAACYIHRIPTRNEKGQLVGMEYEVFSQPTSTAPNSLATGNPDAVSPDAENTDITVRENLQNRESTNTSQATQKTLPGLPPETPPKVQHKEKPRNPIWDAIAEEITHSLAPEGNSGLTATILYGKTRPKIPGFLECYFGNKIQPDTETAERIGILIRRAVKFTVGVQGLSAPGTGEKLCRLVRDYMKSDQYKDAVEMGEITT